MKILVTGAKGFVGKNLVEALSRQEGVTVLQYDIDNPASDLDAFLAQADMIYHLAGVNRPQNVEEFSTGNTGLTQEICAKLTQQGRTPKIVMSSSIQAALDNPYGVSKRLAEEELQHFAESTGAEVVVYRLKNVFGKWCRPNYNSVVATFCHNISHDLPITISNPDNIVNLVYIDDVVEAFISELSNSRIPGHRCAEVPTSYQITLGELSERIRSFRNLRTDLVLADFDDRFNRCLHATYLSYLDTDDFAYTLDIKSDNRGSLAEFIKSPHFGQIFISRTKPGITRGNHYHHTKHEKFLVMEGDAIIRFRQINSDEVIEYKVSGSEYRVLDIPTGYTHSIENVGNTELVVLFWASEIFDPEHPDTYFNEVIR